MSAAAARPAARQSKPRRATAVAVAVLSVGALVGCGSDALSSDRSGHDRDSQAAYQSQAPAGGDYPAKIKRTFVDRCSTSGASRSTCRCVIDAFEQKVPFGEFMRGAIQAQESQQVPPGWRDIVSQCAPSSYDGGDFPTTI